MLLRLIRSSVLACMTMPLLGCFSVELTAPDSVEQNTVFTMSSTPDKNDGAVSYQWSLENSVIPDDATHHAMLPTLGEYTLAVVASTSTNREFLTSNSGITGINASPKVIYSVTENLANENSYGTGNAALTTASGTHSVPINMHSIPTTTGYIQYQIINNSATNSVNGTLDVEMNFDTSFGSLQCSATLDGSDMQYFPCDALVQGSNNIGLPIWADNFSGTPLTADFTYSKDSQQLSIEVASIFDEALLRSGDDGFYISGTGSLVSIDLARETAVAHVVYSVNSESLYSFICLDEGGRDINCDLTWYSFMETIIFEGNIDDLPNPEILPTWMNGKIYVDGSVGYGYAHAPSLSLYSSEPSIDTVNRLITFTLVDISM